MKKTIRYLSILALAASILLSTSCATVISSSSYSVTFLSDPKHATIIVADKKGEVIYTGKTPATVSLKSSSGYFKSASYTYTMEKDGYDPITVPLKCKFDSWYIGNVVLGFGAIFGFLVVDPLSGAMYKIDRTDINETLEKTTTTYSQFQK